MKGRNIMATKNICEVDLLSCMTENTNAIVEENGSLRRVNLNDLIVNSNDSIMNSVVGFMDVSKNIYSTTDENSHDNTVHTLWTATENCWCCVYGKAYADSSYSASLYLDGCRVALFDTAQYTSVCFPMKKGQTLSKGNGYVIVNFYGMFF
jgi:hypothetical protein